MLTCGFLIAISVQCLLGVTIVFGTTQTTEKHLFPLPESWGSDDSRVAGFEIMGILDADSRYEE